MKAFVKVNSKFCQSISHPVLKCAVIAVGRGRGGWGLFILLHKHTQENSDSLGVNFLNSLKEFNVL